MGQLRCAIAALAVALGAAAPAAQAATINGATSLWVFGDSLSDTGNLFRETGQVGDPLTTTGRPYFEGRRSNGPLWSDRLAEDFATRGLPAANFAFIGANGVADTDGIPDLPEQIVLFQQSSAPAVLGTRPVVTLWFGANDVFGGIEVGDSESAGLAAADAVASAAMQLAGFGIGDFVIPNLPNLGLTPFYNLYEGFPFYPPDGRSLATEGTTAFNNAIAARAEMLRGAGLNVVEIDIAGFFDRLVADPSEFGLVDAVLPCLFIPGTGGAFGQPDDCSPEVALERAFYDWVHPNSVVHEGIYGIVRAEVAPVPLPAPALLMLVGLAGLGFAAQRRARV
jgi:outer membrane lipase/esterase